MKTETLPAGTLSIRFEFEKKSQPAKDMQDTLFDIPETLSPRLRWMRGYNIKTQRLSPAIEGLPSWEAEVWKVGPSGVGRRITASGDTEDAALTALALAAGIKLWNEEGA